MMAVIGRAAMPHLVSLVAASALLASCATSAAKLPPLPSTAEAPYRLGAGDRLAIKVFEEANLSGEFRVADDGDVAFPLIGDVRASGLTLDELTQALTERLGAGQIIRPRVNVEVSQYRPVFVLGEVRNPGAYPFAPGMTVREAVALAGGFTYRAALKGFTVTRTRQGGRFDGRAEAATPLVAGDVLNVHERSF